MKTNFLRPLQGLLAVSSFFLLTGAKGQGCRAEEPQIFVDPPAPPAPSCAEGSHLETVCKTYLVEDEGIAVGEPAPGDCHDECVPDNVCPPGMVEQWTCEDYAGCDSLDCPPPPQPECQVTCAPASCPPGTMEEWTCAISDDEPDCDGDDCAPEAEPDCSLSCVPVGCSDGTVTLDE